MDNGVLDVHGVFYLAESGILTRYDRATGNFVTLDAGQ
jgi:hypothetical protein